MSKRKDAERLEAMRRSHPEYLGFRGREREPVRPEDTPLVHLTCTSCGRRRNVPSGMLKMKPEEYVCLACQDQGTAPEGPDEGLGLPGT
ncbi:MAG: hypothetical protein HYU29_00795 [Chloroflexi bacterium]|nr:hypothetical protein [Chloroflexota bacterium]